MRMTLGLGLLVVMCAAPAAAQKVYVDYDRNAIGRDYKTFAWQDTGPTVQEFAPLMHTRIKNGIEHYLTTRGFIEKLDNPDLYVTYHTNSKEEFQFSVTGYGYGYGAGWAWSPYWGSIGMGSASTTVSTYDKGTLVVDIWDAKTKEIVWRGTATAAIPEDPKKAEKIINKALEKMVKQFNDTRAKEAKAK
ncbi:MAG: hypothetical protein C3F15_13820 [Holophagae bacterium]|nr:MAG: hypothetical protein C3F15_13820 [Holophagae bacterium]